MFSVSSESVKELLKQLLAIELKLARYEKALRFYADEKKYLNGGILIDDGRTAREALESKE